MLIETDDAAFGVQLQGARGDKGRGAHAEFDNALRAGFKDMVGEKREEPGVRFPASEMGQDLAFKPQLCVERRARLFRSAVKAAQQPRPSDSAEGEDMRPVGKGFAGNARVNALGQRQIAGGFS